MWGTYKRKWMCFLQHLFSLSKGKAMKGFFNAYRVSARSITYVIPFNLQTQRSIYCSLSLGNVGRPSPKFLTLRKSGTSLRIQLWLNQYRIQVKRWEVTRKTSVEASTIYNCVNIIDMLMQEQWRWIGARDSMEVQRRERPRHKQVLSEKRKSSVNDVGGVLFVARFSALWGCALEAILAWFH